MMMLDLHIEGAAPVTLLVRDESRSTRSTSVNKDEDVDLDVLDQQELIEESMTTTTSSSLNHQQKRLSRNPTSTSESDITELTSRTAAAAAVKNSRTLALQIVDSDQEPMTLAEEMASFEYIDELADSSKSSSFSDFDVWSPKTEDVPEQQSQVDPRSQSQLTSMSKKDRFLIQLEENLLNVPARRASAESLSSNLISPPKEICTSFSVTTELNQAVDQNNSTQLPPQRSRFGNTRQSKLVRQSKVDDHR